ncbi:hypothetical protein D3C79_842200 [compost metagenome]
MLLGEGLGADDRRGGATGRRAGHQAGHHARPDHLVVHHVFDAENLAEDRQRVVGGMAAGLGADHREGFHGGAVFLHVLVTGTTEHGECRRQVGVLGEQLLGDLLSAAVNDRTVSPMVLQRTGLHLLEAQGKGAFQRAGLNGLASQEQG